MFTSYGVGRYVASEADTVLIPRSYPRDGTRRGVLFFHGYGVVTADVLDPSTPNRLSLVRAIAETLPMVRADLGAGSGLTSFNHFGNTNAQTRAGQAKTWLQSASGGGAKSGPVLIVAISMGNLLAINWAKNNPTLVAGIVGIIPAWDTDDIRNNDRGTAQFGAGVLRAAIDSAWGVAYPAALPAGANPATDNAGARGIPYLGYVASDDDLALPGPATAGIAAIGGTAVSVGATGHTDAAFAQVNTAAVLDFLRSHS